MAKNKYDFSGYATKNNLKCSDGRVIQKDAFKHNDGEVVPLVWQHLHGEPCNILGHALLENREDGTYAYCKFNDSETGKNAKELVKNGDITRLSIYANSLKQAGQAVLHGMIREVSLVVSGANPGAVIDNVSFSHADGTIIESEEEVIIQTGLNFTNEMIEHSEGSGSEASQNDILTAINNMSNLLMTHANNEEKTLQDVFDSMTEEQKTVLYAMVGAAMDENDLMQQSSLNDEGEYIMRTNLFDQTLTEENKNKTSLTHSQMNAILQDAQSGGRSLRDTVMAHAAEYGIENIEYLFPEARAIRDTPDTIKRDDSWVTPFLAGVYKTPFSRIKSRAANLTADEARAKGYITGKRKKEEVFPVLRRVTTPTTIYKKQKLDRDDVVDITDFDVVLWLKGEMRLMLNEELARAILIGDGREADAEDHINDSCIRPVWKDDEIYAPKVLLKADTTTLELIDEVVRARKLYKGPGTPNFYTTEDIATDMLLVRDLNQRRIYPTMAELASALRVREVVSVEPMEDQTRLLPNSTEAVDLKGILLNPSDYTVGADKGGEVNLFDDFDIDYNQYKYLIETRVSGALTKPKTAVVIEQRKGVEAEG